MAIENVRISDIVPNEKLFGATVDLLLAANNPLLTSGLAQGGPAVDAVAGGGSRKASIPFLRPLSTDTVNIGSDILKNEGAVDSFGADEFDTRRIDMNKGLGFADLTTTVTGYDAKGGAPAALADFWRAIYVRMAVAAMKGALKKDAALTYTSEAGASIYEAAIMATATAGDNADAYNILCVNAANYARLRVDQKNAFVPASQTESRFDEWAGFKLVKTQSFGNDLVVARPGALAFGSGTPRGILATEIERKANGADGQGGDILHSRRSVVIHPQGFSNVGDNLPVGLNNIADIEAALSNAARWALKVPVEQVAFRKVILTPAA